MTSFRRVSHSLTNLNQEPIYVLLIRLKSVCVCVHLLFEFDKSRWRWCAKQVFLFFIFWAVG